MFYFIDGQVRIWKISKHIQTLQNAMKEHKGSVIYRMIIFKLKKVR